EFSTQLQGDNMLGQLAVDWDDGAPSLPADVTGTYMLYDTTSGSDVVLTNRTDPPSLGETVTLNSEAQQILADDSGRPATFAVVVELEFTGMPDRFGSDSPVQTADLGQLRVTLEQARTGVGFQ